MQPTKYKQAFYWFSGFWISFSELEKMISFQFGELELKRVKH